mgnify:CR=1 FL=1
MLDEEGEHKERKRPRRSTLGEEEEPLIQSKARQVRCKR